LGGGSSNYCSRRKKVTLYQTFPGKSKGPEKLIGKKHQHHLIFRGDYETGTKKQFKSKSEKARLKRITRYGFSSGKKDQKLKRRGRGVLLLL